MTRPQGHRRSFKRQQLWEQQNGRCYYCGTPITYRGRRDSPYFGTFDHVVPASKGGTRNQVVLACNHCNQMKRDLPAEEFLRMLEKSSDGRRNARHTHR